MLQIFLCDDEPLFCRALAKNVRQAAEQQGIPANITCCTSGAALLELCSKEQPDILFLDIELHSEPDGIDTARLLRDKYQYRTEIVFVSAHTGYSLQLFALQPLDFLVKPPKEQQLTRVFADYMKRHPQNALFQSQSGSKKICVPFSDILLIETAGKHHCNLVTAAGSFTLPLSVPFKTFAAEFAAHRFLKVNSSSFVNPDWILYIERNAIHLKPQQVYSNALYISRGEMKEFFQNYMR